MTSNLRRIHTSFVFDRNDSYHLTYVTPADRTMSRKMQRITSEFKCSFVKVVALFLYIPVGTYQYGIPVLILMFYFSKERVLLQGFQGPSRYRSPPLPIFFRGYPIGEYSIHGARRQNVPPGGEYIPQLPHVSSCGTGRKVRYNSYGWSLSCAVRGLSLFVNIDLEDKQRFKYCVRIV